MAAGASNIDFQKSIERLLKSQPGWKRAIQPPDKGAKPGGKGVGRPASGASGVDLVEQDAATRQYHETPYILRSSDGILTIEVSPIKQINLQGNGRIVFAEPPAEPV